MSYFIIIRGPLAVGKTTVSKELARILDGEYISFDKLMEEHELDRGDEDEGCIPARNFVKANEIIIPKIEKLLENGKIVILDSCFYHKKSLVHLYENLPHRHYAFTLKAPVEVCIQRDRGREWVYGEGAARAVHEMVSGFDEGIVIDTDGKTLAQTVEEITSHLPPLSHRVRGEVGPL
jgi:tRNA uridine 5-carbamoylmethylation protein Kti12